MAYRKVSYRLFVSHVWRAQHDLYWGLMRLLSNAERFSLVDLSVPRFRPFDGTYADSRDEIFEALRSADVVLVVNTKEIDDSIPVADELNEAIRLRIPIIAISPPKRNGKQPKSTLRQLKDARSAAWTAESIITEIRKARKIHKQRVLSLSELFEPVKTTTANTNLSPTASDRVAADNASPHASENDGIHAHNIVEITPLRELSRAKKPWFVRLFQGKSHE